MLLGEQWPNGLRKARYLARLMIGSRHSDVSFELKPLDSGHMLVLEYDLVLPLPAKLPSLADMYSERGRLRDQLVAWNSAVTKESTTGDNSFPTLLAHICDSTYNAQSLSFDLLERDDRLRAAYLREVCAELHMGLYIADLDRTLTGFAKTIRMTTIFI